MARKRTIVADVDWYLISIQRLKQLGLIILLLVLGLSGWWYFTNQKRNPRSTAESAIAAARGALNELAASKDFSSHRTEFDRAQKKLDAAGTLLNAGNYASAQENAVESQTISRAAMSGAGGTESDAQFLNVEGDVQYQKSSTSEWKRADQRVPLFNGDWVKTADNASAELMFANGSLYTVGPNALLEIYAQFNPATSRTSNSVQMQIGSIEVNTSDDVSTVRTPSSNVTVDSDSSTQVAVDRQKATSVVATKGSASIASSGGGAPVKISSGEKVSATAQGSLSPVRKLLLPPALLTPADNQVYPMSDESRVDFSWDSVGGATTYVFQVSRSRMFATLEINSRRQKNTAVARVTAEGPFYWRVASIGPDGEPGPFSISRRFRVSGEGAQGGISGEAPPPKLQLKRPYPIGGPFYMIEGATDPGATVLINDEEVDVDSSGNFKKLVSFSKLGRNTVVVKAVNAAGKQTIQSVPVLVEE